MTRRVLFTFYRFGVVQRQRVLRAQRPENVAAGRRFISGGVIMGAGRKGFVSTLLLAAAVTAGLSAKAHAAVVNSSFGTPTTGSYIDDSNGAINNPSNASFWGWGYFFANTSGDHDSGVQANTNSDVTNPANNAAQNGWVNGGGNYLYQDLGALAPDTTYSVTVAVAAPGGTAYGGLGAGNSQPTDEVDLLNGTNTVSGTNAGVATNGTLLAGSGVITPPNGSFQDVTVSFTTGASPSNDLVLQLMEDTTGAHEQGIFGDVRETVTAVPEPTTAGLMCMGSLLALRRRKAR